MLALRLSDRLVAAAVVGGDAGLGEEEGQGDHREHARHHGDVQGPGAGEPAPAHQHQGGGPDDHHREQPVVAAGEEGDGQPQADLDRPAPAALGCPPQHGVDQQQQGEHHRQLEHPELGRHEGQGQAQASGDGRRHRLGAERAGQPVPGEAVERERGQQHQVEGQHRVAAEEGQRRERQPGERLGLGQREPPGGGMEQRRVPVVAEPVADGDLVPAQRPEVEQRHRGDRLGPVVEGRARVQGHRPGHDGGESDIQRDQHPGTHSRRRYPPVTTLVARGNRGRGRRHEAIATGPRPLLPRAPSIDPYCLAPTAGGWGSAGGFVVIPPP